MSERWTVVQSEHLSEAAARWLTERCELLVCRYDDPAFARAMEHADGLVVRTYTLVNEELLSKSPRLKVVGRAGVGLDNIDVPACQQRGVQVVSTPDANTQAVVEYVAALMLDVFRPRVTLGEAVERQAWNLLREEICGKRQLSELTVGILGLGRIGKRIAGVMRAIGAEVIYHDVAEIAEALRHGARAVSLEELLAKSDVLTIHIDGRATNRHFLNAERIAQLRRDVVVINTSRGFVIDPAAMAAFLAAHPQATAVLDVHEPEPFDAGYPLLGLANARLYPHLASRTETAMNNMSWVVRDVVAVLEGKRPAFGAW